MCLFGNNNCGGNEWIWIFVIIILICCCGNNGCENRDCDCQHPCC
ncbi:MAG: hypothetical protein ACI4DP_12830 [Candidatus Ornithomonoglobus sp.]